MSDEIRPENAEDVVQRTASDAAIDAAVSGEKSCPSVPGVIFAEFPEYGQLKSLMEAGVGAASSLKARVLTPPDPEAAVNEAKDAVSDAATKVRRAAAKAAKDIKDGAAQIATNAKQAALDELDKVDKLIEAIGQGVIDIGTDLQNIDEITLNAMAVQFPGFKDARECLNGPADSGAAVANSKSADDQIVTPVPDNPAKVKSDVADAIVPLTTEQVEAAQEQQGITPDPLRSIEGEFRKEYPHVLVDPDDPNKVYAVYPGVPKVDIYNISSGKARLRGIDADIDEVNAKYNYINILELPVQKQRVDDEGEDAGDEVTELPE